MILRQGERFEDEFGYFYLLGKKVNEGGQGAVYRIEGDDDIALKIAVCHNDNPAQDSIQQEEKSPLTVINEDVKEVEILRERLKNVRLLPIPKTLNISRPLCLIKDGAGYIMSFMGGKPFSAFNKKDHPEQTSEYPCFQLNEDGTPTEHADYFFSYIKSGGTRKRLLALGQAAISLSELHNQGLIFGDISEGNIMFSTDKNHIRIGLIDVDNICFENKAGGESVYTPGLGAPEIVNGTSGSNTMSDSYAFAVMAFRLLTLLHPFDDGENQTEAWSQQSINAEPKEEDKPWIYDRNDDSNKVKENKVQVYVPLAMTIDDNFELFQNTFSKGLNKPIYRTPLIKWSSSFLKAADRMILCPKCRMTYFFDYKDAETGKFGCPWCDEKNPDYIKASSYFVTDKGVLTETRWIFCHEIIDRIPVILPRRMFSLFSTVNGDEDSISIYKKGDELIFENLCEDIDVFIATEERKDFVKITRRHQFKLLKNKPFYLYTSDKKTKRSILVVLTYTNGDE